MTWVGQECALQGGPYVQHPPPSLGRADLAAKATPTRLFPQGTEGTHVLPSLQAVSRGRKWVSILQVHRQLLPLMLPRYQCRRNLETSQAQYKKEP